jgi:hypothetical protein
MEVILFVSRLEFFWPRKCAEVMREVGSATDCHHRSFRKAGEQQKQWDTRCYGGQYVRHSV